MHSRRTMRQSYDSYNLTSASDRYSTSSYGSSTSRPHSGYYATTRPSTPGSSYAETCVEKVMREMASERLEVMGLNVFGPEEDIAQSEFRSASIGSSIINLEYESVSSEEDQGTGRLAQLEDKLSPRDANSLSTNVQSNNSSPTREKTSSYSEDVSSFHISNVPHIAQVARSVKPDPQSRRTASETTPQGRAPFSPGTRQGEVVPPQRKSSLPNMSLAWSGSSDGFIYRLKRKSSLVMSPSPPQEYLVKPPYGKHPLHSHSFQSESRLPLSTSKYNASGDYNFWGRTPQRELTPESARSSLELSIKKEEGTEQDKKLLHYVRQMCTAFPLGRDDRTRLGWIRRKLSLKNAVLSRRIRNRFSANELMTTQGRIELVIFKTFIELARVRDSWVYSVGISRDEYLRKHIEAALLRIQTSFMARDVFVPWLALILSFSDEPRFWKALDLYGCHLLECVQVASSNTEPPGSRSPPSEIDGVLVSITLDAIQSAILKVLAENVPSWAGLSAKLKQPTAESLQKMIGFQQSLIMRQRSNQKGYQPREGLRNRQVAKPTLFHHKDLSLDGQACRDLLGCAIPVVTE